MKFRLPKTRSTFYNNHSDRCFYAVLLPFPAADFCDGGVHPPGHCKKGATCLTNVRCAFAQVGEVAALLQESSGCPYPSAAECVAMRFAAAYAGPFTASQTLRIVTHHLFLSSLQFPARVFGCG